MRTVLVLALLPAFAAGDGERLYSAYCAHCHGAGAEGARGPALNKSPLPRAKTEEAFLNVVIVGIPDTEMPPSRLSPVQVREIRAYLMELSARTGARPTGDPRNGQALFRGKGGCLRCHMVQGEGGRMGPELTSIGEKGSEARLRSGLLDPAVELPNQFAQYRLVIPMPDNFLIVRLKTKTGRELTGIRLNEDPVSIQIRDLSDGLHSFLKQDLVEIQPQPGSPMPSYRGVLTESEINDLIAYMFTLRRGQ